MVYDGEDMDEPPRLQMLVDVCCWQLVLCGVEFNDMATAGKDISNPFPLALQMP